MFNKGGPGDVDGSPFYMNGYPEKEKGQKGQKKEGKKEGEEEEESQEE